MASGVTQSVDLNNDQSIDPNTEQGLYRIAVGAGTWGIGEDLVDGWRQTFPNGGDALAWYLDQKHDLQFTGSLFKNWGGLGEVWMFGDGDWYFLTPAGNLFRWNGSPQTNLSGEFIGAPGQQVSRSTIVAL